MEISKSNWLQIRKLLSGYTDMIESLDAGATKPHVLDKARRCRKIIRDIERINEHREAKRGSRADTALP